MESIYTTQRPSLLAPACAPSVALPNLAGMRASLPQVHWVQIQAELARTAVLGDSGKGITGFVGGVSVKGAASGVPPRGRPV